jgi:protein-disulfide isomerase
VRPALALACAADHGRMSHRVEAKARARAAREEAERREAAQAVRRRRVRRLLAAVAVTVAAAGAAVAVSAGGGAEPVAGAGEAKAMLAGIPQDGTRLGDPRAPLVLTEYADLQCPYCAGFATDVLPQLIDRYVRPGKLQIDLKLLRFLGTDSDRGARAAHAAGTRDRLWHFVDLFYRNQGPENTGYADDGFLRGIGVAAGAPAVLDAVTSSAHEDALTLAEADAQKRGIDSTPSFTLGRRGGEGRRLELPSVDIDTFAKAIEPQLEG